MSNFCAQIQCGVLTSSKSIQLDEKLTFAAVCKMLKNINDFSFIFSGKLPKIEGFLRTPDIETKEISIGTKST